MKKFILVIICMTLLNLLAQTQSLAKPSQELGLISYLTTVKSLAEFKMTTLVYDKNYSDPKYSDKTKGFQSRYNLLKLDIDKLINQMAADMVAKNRLNVYKQLNKYVKGKKKTLPAKFQKYEALLTEIDGKLESFLMSTYASTLAGATLEEITAIIELGYGVYSDIRDFNEKKVTNINLILKDLKLASLKDLTEPKKEAKSEKE